MREYIKSGPYQGLFQIKALLGTNFRLGLYEGPFEIRALLATISN